MVVVNQLSHFFWISDDCGIQIPIRHRIARLQKVRNSQEISAPLLYLANPFPTSF